jgi:hypothetical protein
MEDREMTSPVRGKRWLLPTALVTVGFLGGAALAGTQIAAAAGSSSETSAWTLAVRDLAGMSHGPGEELVTGSKADRIEAAALEEVPGGTVIRVETDSGGAAYEAHVETSDGDVVTVLFDEDLEVTGTESGPGPGGVWDCADE